MECFVRRFPSLCRFSRQCVLDSDAFRPGLLGEVDDALGVLGVDRVVPIVARVPMYEEEDVLVVRSK